MGFECESNKDRKKFIQYDIIVKEPPFTIEVKDDLFSAKSGNAAIEYWNSRSNKPSGITATKSDVWCHIICDEPFVVKTEALKKFLNEVKPKRILQNIGDGNADIMLYDIEVIKTCMVSINDIRELL